MPTDKAKAAGDEDVTILIEPEEFFTYMPIIDRVTVTAPYGTQRPLLGSLFPVMVVGSNRLPVVHSDAPSSCQLEVYFRLWGGSRVP
jgi:hypothetical protein